MLMVVCNIFTNISVRYTDGVYNIFPKISIQDRTGVCHTLTNLPAQYSDGTRNSIANISMLCPDICIHSRMARNTVLSSTSTVRRGGGLLGRR
jgi:hypothetical protein